jgi:2',3'-cyclic-nucleotide 2'-phosphodiesterase (5'-nucleotidase family)
MSKYILFVLLILFVSSCGDSSNTEYDVVCDGVFDEHEAEIEDEEDEIVDVIVVEPENPTFYLTILHTNDIHGIIHELPKYATLINQVREETENVLLLDAGDLWRRGPYEMFHGAVEIDVLNKMGFDALVLGNNDFPRNNDEVECLSQMTILHLAEFPILSANILIDGELIDGIEPYTVINMGGLDICIIGLSLIRADQLEYDVFIGHEYMAAQNALDMVLEEVRETTDIQIALAHLELSVLRRLRGVSAIISGHDHEFMYTPTVVGGNIPLVQAGGESRHFLGRLDLVYELIDDEWILTDFSGLLLPVFTVEPDLEIQELIDYHNTYIEPAA